MGNDEKPEITIPIYDINTKYTYKPIIVLTEEDYAYLNIWREKARRIYKRVTGYYSLEEEKHLIDPDPFTDKWYIFSISHKRTPKSSPLFSLPPPPPPLPPHAL